MELKTCSKCGDDFPNTTEYFYTQGNHTTALKGQCKECHKATKRGKKSYPKSENPNVNRARVNDMDFMDTERDLREQALLWSLIDSDYFRKPVSDLTVEDDLEWARKCEGAR